MDGCLRGLLRFLLLSFLGLIGGDDPFDLFPQNDPTAG